MTQIFTQHLATVKPTPPTELTWPSQTQKPSPRRNDVSPCQATPSSCCLRFCSGSQGHPEPDPTAAGTELHSTSRLALAHTHCNDSRALSPGSPEVTRREGLAADAEDAGPTPSPPHPSPPPSLYRRSPCFLEMKRAVRPPRATNAAAGTPTAIRGAFRTMRGGKML